MSGRRQVVRELIVDRIAADLTGAATMTRSVGVVAVPVSIFVEMSRTCPVRSAAGGIRPRSVEALLPSITSTDRPVTHIDVFASTTSAAVEVIVPDIAIFVVYVGYNQEKSDTLIQRTVSGEQTVCRGTAKMLKFRKSLEEGIMKGVCDQMGNLPKFGIYE